VGGIDVAGTVVASTDPDWREGDAVLATGCGLSETRDGGYSQYVRLESRAVIAQPAGLSPREAMVLGTAGFTAALALLRMQDNRQTLELGPLAVTGASGGVGALALSIFSRAGYTVHAVSGKPTRPTSCAHRCQRGAAARGAGRHRLRCSRRASAGAWTMPAATCWPACWRRPCPTAAWSVPAWRPARRWT
jgi:putative YhdH/YhfP family quinone oxidoreductase